jgi:DNA-binding response OmpR family regulator/DNA-binding CsgD family transcriptional regulator
MSDVLKDSSPVVLIVDDVLDNLAYLHDALDESGYKVLIASSGSAAIDKARLSQPSIILLDAVMPGMDGFETCKKLKSDASVGHIPVIFMTGLTEAEHVAAGFEAGGVDYVTKPIRPKEVLARIASHLQTVKLMNQARSALDAFGQATIAISPKSLEIIWKTPLARELILDYFSSEVEASDSKTPNRVLKWIEDSLKQLDAKLPLQPLNVIQNSKRLVLTMGRLTDDEWVVMLREESDTIKIEALISTFKLTKKEAEVLYWVIKGKTNKDIGDILGSSSRTVNKHLEHIFFKLGVETRTAAAALVASMLRL